MRLDDAYANGAYIAGAEDYPDRWKTRARDFIDQHKDQCELDLLYGNTKRQAYDLFRPEGPHKGTVIFVHGGYWRAFDKSYWSHLAQGPLAQGWAVAMPSYDLCPDVRISDITRQIALAVQAIAKKMPGRLSLTGHSAGGHLVARMLDPKLLPARVAARIDNVVPISPLSDLTPLLRTSMNDDFRLDEAEAKAESPVNMEDRRRAAVTVWVGASERPSFLSQARWLKEAWNAKIVISPGRHHFDVIDALEEPSSGMTQALIL